jgi:hypothetical protein
MPTATKAGTGELRIAAERCAATCRLGDATRGGRR